jgi:hypothetical protein
VSEEGETFTIEDGPAFRLEDGLIIAVGDGDDLDALPAEPADKVPVDVLEELDGLSVSALREPSDCVAAYGTSADADGSGELVVEVAGEPSLDQLQIEDSDAIAFGEPETDGSTISIPVSADEEGIPAADRALQMFLVVYECD